MSKDRAFIPNVRANSCSLLPSTPAPLLCVVYNLLNFGDFRNHFAQSALNAILSVIVELGQERRLPEAVASQQDQFHEFHIAPSEIR